MKPFLTEIYLSKRVIACSCQTKWLLRSFLSNKSKTTNKLLSCLFEGVASIFSISFTSLYFSHYYYFFSLNNLSLYYFFSSLFHFFFKLFIFAVYLFIVIFWLTFICICSVSFYFSSSFHINIVFYTFAKSLK